MIDRAIDRLKGELSQKEKDIIKPLAYRQKSMIEDQQEQKKKVETRLAELEQMVVM